MKKKLAIITWDAISVALYAQQAHTFFGEDLEIQTYSVQAGQTQNILPADAYLVSTCAFSDRDIDQLLPPNSNVVISEVHITRKGLSRLIGIPRNTPALLVNINQAMVTETAAMLNQLGITNIQFIPYYPGAPEPPRVHCAITTGEVRYVPDWVEQVIDLGPRLLSGNTFIALAFHLKMESILMNPEFQAYLSSLAERSYGIEKMIQRSVQIQSLANLFQQTQDAGVIGVDANGSVFFCSPKAAELLETSVERFLGQTAQDVLSVFPFRECFANRKTIHNRAVEFQGLRLSVTIQPFYQNRNLAGCFCMFQQPQDREKQKSSRQSLSMGHVTKYTFDSLIGESQAMLNAKALAKKMAASKAAVLITGESGTGKELFAHAIHAASARAQYPFVAINCAAMPDSLLESQLFGYEEGAFTGAKKKGHIGFFETARNGTLFLDEIEAMSPMLQAKLLRVIQEKEIVRLGGVDVIHVDFRIIAASNEDLPTIVREGGFRKDLFYRLNVLPLQLPPLRERGMDIQLLFEHIRRTIQGEFTLSQPALQVLLNHRWDGNIRELRNCVEYLACLEKNVIEPEDLPFGIQCASAEKRSLSLPDPAASSQKDQAVRQLCQCAGRNLDKYRFLLHQLSVNPSMGRKVLSKLAEEEQLLLTEQSIRTMMGHLERLGIVEIQRGRSGTHLTALGREVSDALND